MKKLPSAIIGTLATASFVALLLSLSTTAALKLSGKYGYSLFLGAPFVGGAAATLLYSRTASLRVRDVFSMSSIVAALSSLCLLALGADGLMCVIMAFPVALPSAWLGGILAYTIGRMSRWSRPGRVMCLALFPPLWLALAVESQIPNQPDVVSVSTEIEISANSATVWRSVIAFPPIVSKLSPIFQFGIAYPTSAAIDGHGVGAIRRCVFNTGVFIEPITAWEEGHRLEFDVVESPPPMKETSFYPDLAVPHLRDTFVSQHGRFLLSPTKNGSVVLEGTTWYRQRLWPQIYWNFVANEIVHRIHLRVLYHIKEISERENSDRKE